MKTLYIDVTNTNALGFFIKSDENIRLVGAGTEVQVEEVEEDTKMKELANQYDIYFFNENNMPIIDFYTIPYMKIIARDSLKGYIGIIEEQNKEGFSICYISHDQKCYMIAKGVQDFLKGIENWQNRMKECDEIRVYSSQKEAEKEVEFLKW